MLADPGHTQIVPFPVQLIYSGLVGEQSSALIECLEAVPGVQPIRSGENPATWMLEVTGGASVTGKSKAAKVDFAEYYKVSPLFCKTCMRALAYKESCLIHW